MEFDTLFIFKHLVRYSNQYSRHRASKPFHPSPTQSDPDLQCKFSWLL